ncbi:actin-related protein 2/3 complex subunit 2B-like isoform X2 [Hevea brasiliensis]|uniref:actin-related protein 2/3 complex subunit 2B-like isoform X2 n=1 Tax=Hevea brasiliensis TaxID=3981 RepID=UPI0025E3BC37|nr:actin-related protein 2/3 complex subunit 2B-like isoform X2 [Hevea brasiliensis]
MSILRICLRGCISQIKLVYHPREPFYVIKQCTRGFTQRRMQKHLESLVEVLHKENQEEDENAKKVKGRKYVRKLLRFPRSAMLKQRCGEFTKKIKGIRFRIKIQGFGHFRRRWLTIPKFSSPMRYTKPD